MILKIWIDFKKYHEKDHLDLLWSDPVEHDDNKEANIDDSDSDSLEIVEPTTWFAYNETRRCSYVWYRCG